MESPEIEPIVANFWNPKFGEHDLSMYNRFLDILRLSKNGQNGEQIGKTLHMNNVRKYLKGDKISFLTLLRLQRERLGVPAPGHQWLPLRLRPRGTPGPDWIQAPVAPVSYSSVAATIAGVAPIVGAPLHEASWKARESETWLNRENLFGFFLGVMIGDASKPLKGTHRFSSMAVALTLSKGKSNGLDFGEFTAYCGNASIGIGMHRIADAPPSSHRFTKEECFRWISSASPLVSWVFQECLGLEVEQRTTYDSLVMDWVLSAPREFQVSVLQGLAESDGWPNPGADEVRLVSSPNTRLLKSVLDGLDCDCSVIKQPPVELLSLSTEDAYSLPLFSPVVGSDLYKKVEILAKAKHYEERRRLPQETIELIRKYCRTSKSLSDVCLRIAETTGYKVSSETVRKYSGL